MFCQWIELTQWTPEQFNIAAATFRKVFGHLYLLRTSFKTGSVPLGLLGFKEGGPDWTTVARRCDFESRNGRVLDPLCRHVEGVAMLYLGEYVPPAEFENRVNTLGNLRIELSACRQLVSQDPDNYYSGSGAAWLGLLRDQLVEVASEKAMPESLKPYPQTGFLAAKLEIAVEGSDPSATTLARKLIAEMPDSALSDPQADWALWPGNRLPWAVLGIPRPVGVQRFDRK